jgi:hypothetical protein
MSARWRTPKINSLELERDPLCSGTNEGPINARCAAHTPTNADEVGLSHQGLFLRPQKGVARWVIGRPRARASTLSVTHPRKA